MEGSCGILASTFGGGADHNEALEVNARRHRVICSNHYMRPLVVRYSWTSVAQLHTITAWAEIMWASRLG